MTPQRKGQLLIASRRLVDPNFVRTVVLIVQHDDSGVLGLILNRPLELTVADACDPSAEEAADVTEPMHQGGPCTGPLMVLHGSEIVSGLPIIPGVRFSTERDEIRTLMRDHPGQIRYFAGYSGWSVQQLEGEIEEGAWLVAPAAAGEVFTDDPDNQWARLMSQLTLGQWVDVDRLPEDPSVN